MKRIVSHGFFRPLAPLLVGLQDILLGIRNDKIDDHRRPAGKARCGSCIEVFTGDRTHERQLHMRMRIDSAWHDILAAGVDDLRALRRIETLSYSLNFPAATQHIGAE